MGYLTQYELEITGKDIDDYSIINELIKENQSAKFALDEYGETEESCKWYDHEKDLREFSKRYPEALFLLSGEGEEQPDMWKEYYKNGKMQRCEAVFTFSEFNEKELK